MTTERTRLALEEILGGADVKDVLLHCESRKDRQSYDLTDVFGMDAEELSRQLTTKDFSELIMAGIEVQKTLEAMFQDAMIDYPEDRFVDGLYYNIADREITMLFEESDEVVKQYRAVIFTWDTGGFSRSNEKDDLVVVKSLNSDTTGYGLYLGKLQTDGIVI